MLDRDRATTGNGICLALGAAAMGDLLLEDAEAVESLDGLLLVCDAVVVDRAGIVECHGWVRFFDSYRIHEKGDPRSPCVSVVGPSPGGDLNGGQWGRVLGAIHLGGNPLPLTGGEVRGEDERHRIR